MGHRALHQGCGRARRGGGQSRAARGGGDAREVGGVQGASGRAESEVGAGENGRGKAVQVDTLG